MTLMTRKKCKDKHILSPNTVNLILGKDAIYVTTLKRATYKAVLGIFRRTRQTNFTQNLHFSPKMLYLCTVNQRECYKGSTGGIYYDQGRSQ